MDCQIRNVLRFPLATVIAMIAIVLLCASSTSHAQTFDPLGRSVLPTNRGILAPQGGGTINSLGIGPTQLGQSYQGPQIQPRIQQSQSASGFGQNPFQSSAFNQQRPNVVQPSNFPIGPAFTRAPTAPPCGNPNCNDASCTGGCRNSQPKKRHFVPSVDGRKTPGQNGQLIMTPSRIVAPVGSEVVVLAGICGGDGFFVKNQPLEWLLSNDSVGQIIEVGGMHHELFNKVVGPNAKKFDGQYAWGRTGLKPLILTRGTPTPVDDIQLLKGQTFLSLSSESPGTTYLTGVAPNAEGWDRRRASTRIHWVDGTWSIPAPMSATAGTVAPLSTVVTRSDGSGGVEDWKVRYSIVGGAPAEFAPAGSQTAEATTNRDGEAIAQIRQRAGQFEPGTTQVRVDVVRPAFGSEPELVVESGLTQIIWSAPALTIRAIGPGEAVSDEPFNYRVEVSNPGDQLTRGVVVSTKDFDPSIEFISSNPKPTQYGNQYQWDLGDVAAGSQPRFIDLQLRSKKRGNVGMCFEVASETDRLRTEACAQTEITGACIGLEVEGPETAMVGDEVTFQIGLVNQCDEPLRNVQLRITPDPGLIASGTGTRIIEGSVDEIAFGEKEMIPVQFQAIREGRQCFRLDVVADGGHDAGLLKCVIVSQSGASGVRLQVRGGTPIRVGEATLVQAVITNTGNLALNAVALESQTEQSVVAARVSPGTTVLDDGSDGKPVVLGIGSLNPGDSTVVDIEYEGVSVDGSANVLLTVTSAEEVTDSEELTLRVEPSSAGDNRGIDPNRPDFGNTPQIPNSGSQSGSGSGTGTDEPQINIPQDNAQLGQSRLSVQVESAKQPIRARVGEEAPVRFRVENNDTFVHENVRIAIEFPDGLQYSNFDPGNSPLRTISQLFPDMPSLEFDTRRSLRAGESLEGVLYVTGKTVGQHPIKVLLQSEQTEVLDATDFVNVSQ